MALTPAHDHAGARPPGCIFHQGARLVLWALGNSWRLENPGPCNEFPLSESLAESLISTRPDASQPSYSGPKLSAYTPKQLPNSCRGMFEVYETETETERERERERVYACILLMLRLSQEHGTRIFRTLLAIEALAVLKPQSQTSKRACSPVNPTWLTSIPVTQLLST